MTEKIVVIGASMGGIETLCELLPGLPIDFGAAVLVVLHTGSGGGGLGLSQVLQRCSRLPVAPAQDGESLRASRIYIPPHDSHLLVHKGHLRVSRGPRENGSRPAIDPLFRTAAVAARQNCVGLILSGLLDDGAAGLLAVQQCGGQTLIQDPADARFPDMPNNTLRLLQPDYLLPARLLAAALVEAVARPRPVPAEPPRQLKDEVVLTLRAAGLEGHGKDMQTTRGLGEPVPIICPECGGTLWRVGEHYRCHVGHAYSQRILMDCQQRQLEKALWAAVRALEEKRKMLEKIHQRDPNSALAQSNQEKMREVQQHADQIRQVLLRVAALDD